MCSCLGTLLMRESLVDQKRQKELGAVKWEFNGNTTNKYKQSLLLRKCLQLMVGLTLLFLNLLC